jgi:hypothetical protein
MAYLGREAAKAPLVTADIPDDSITAAKIVDATIAAGDLAANSVDSSELVDGSIDTSHIADNQVTLAKMAGGTDGNIISYDASGDPVAIATGDDGQVLTSTGAGSPPAFEDAAGGTTGISDSGDAVAVTITSGEYVGINEGTPLYRLHITEARATNWVCKMLNSASDGAGLMVFAGSTSGHKVLKTSTYDGTEKFKVQGDGATYNAPGTYGTLSSDERMKENIVDGTAKLDKLNQVRVVNFNFIDDDLKQLGFIAQEVKEIFPALAPTNDSRNIILQTEYDDLSVDEKTKYKQDSDDEWCKIMSNGEIYGYKDSMSLKSSVFTPILVKAVQELSAKNDALEARIVALEAKE